ncbi:MAG: DUF6431 domain-containing protein [Legionellaceae bacterium]|nr:DUF6431 domain-containing protein [Legionellaceae bacterium]
MRVILPDIATLEQYCFKQTTQSIELRPQECWFCGMAGLHCHATYERQSDRENKGRDSLNPVIIQRYICPYCRKTCSVLPECIPPRRWYPWPIQQAILLACLLGKSLNEISRQHIPSRSTCKRWWDWLQERFHDLAHELKSLFPDELGRCPDFLSFWSSCIKKMNLSKAMWYCHQSGVIVP